MAKYYRKNSVDAEQFDPKGNWPEEIISWDSAGYKPRDMSHGYIQRGSERVHVFAGDWIVREGDWITVHRPSEFEKNYEPVPETQNRTSDEETEEEDGEGNGGNHPGKPGNP